jgi:predicted SprT family Zn-dependent metalloprotease
MLSLEKPKSRLVAHAPQCLRCRKVMKVRTLRPERKVDDVVYRCEQCGDEIVVEVKRVW